MIVVVDYAKVDYDDHDPPPNWDAFQAACVAAGSRASVAIMRGAYGIDPDPTVKRDWWAAKGKGFTTGAYLFLRPAYRVVDQIHAYYAAVGDLRVDDLPPILDLEGTWPSPAIELAALVEASAEMARLYGTSPMIYDSARIWREDLPGLVPPDRIKDCPQWVAKPWPWEPRTQARLSPGPFVNGKYDPPVPPAWGPGNWWIHQYQGDALPTAGFPGTVDLSRFHLMVEGERGERVRWVQRRLGIEQTGEFDVSMVSKIRSFQSQHGLLTDAIIGPRTFAVICWTHSNASPR